MKLYLAGPMRGIPEFNFPAFHTYTKALREEGHEVFSPAEKDIEIAGTDISKGNETGDEAIALAQHGFSIRQAMEMDLTWICREADAVALMPGWENSRGAKAEKAAAEAIGIEVIYLG